MRWERTNEEVGWVEKNECLLISKSSDATGWEEVNNEETGSEARRRKPQKRIVWQAPQGYIW